MKLFYSKTSPFARKVIISAMKLNLLPQLELTSVDVFNDSHYHQINPLVKVPSLEYDQGKILTNSPFICEYLNSSSEQKNLYAPGDGKWVDLQNQSLADGMMEAAVLRRLESLRPHEKQDPNFDKRQKDKIVNVLSYFNRKVLELKKDWTIGEISLACSLGYIEFRFANENLLTPYHEVNHWFEDAKKMEWMIRTQPS